MKFIALKAGPYPDLIVERRNGQLKQYAPETRRRPAEHWHGYNDNLKPVLSFDLHGTLTPDWGYPLVSPPFPGVKDFMDEQVARGCCIHLMSASLDNPDPDTSKARTAQVVAFRDRYGLPISFIGPNAEASVRLDDRGVMIPPEPDWSRIADQAVKRLQETWQLDGDRWVRRDDLVPQGDPLDDDDFPSDDEVPQDQPRGFSTPLIDLDLHRTIMPAWGTTREADPMSGAVDAIKRLYNAPYSIQISCGGWNPAITDPAFVGDRAAFQRQWLRCYSIPYDRLVAKDDCDLWFDDKVIQFKNWKQAERDILARLGPAIPWASNHPINEPSPFEG